MDPIVEANIERWRGFADAYDRRRPAPPDTLLDWIMRYRHTGETHRELPVVVDLGAGTGLSTFVWERRAGLVIGVEPSDDMIRVASTRSRDDDSIVRFVRALATATGLPDRCADIVTCSQSLHWLEPRATFTEVTRLLRSGGVFAAYDYDWPPATGSAHADGAYESFMARATQLERTMHIPSRAHLYRKDEHLERMRQSGQFTFVRELLVHHEIEGDADRFAQLTLTQGAPATLRKLGVTDAALGVPAFRAAVNAALGARAAPWLLCYRVRIGIVP